PHVSPAPTPWPRAFAPGMHYFEYLLCYNDIIHPKQRVVRMIRVLVVEDQQLFKDGVKALLAQEDDIEVIGLACNGEEAIRQIKDQQPDVVLMDIHMPQVDGIKATLYIKEHYPDIKVVLLTTYAQKDAVIMGLNAGADGFLLKSLDAERLIRTIRDAY